MAKVFYSVVSFFCFFFIIIVMQRTKQNIGKSKRRDIFVKVMASGLGYLLLDALWGGFDGGFLTPPKIIMLICDASYFCSAGFMAYYWYIYTDNLLNENRHIKTWLKVLRMLPLILLVALAYSSVWNGTMFYRDDACKYHRGDYYYIQMILTYGYILIAIVKVLWCLIREKGYQEQSRMLIIASFSMYPIFFGCLQIMYLDMPCLCVGVTLAILQSYIFVQSHEKERIDSLSKIVSFSELFIDSYYVDVRSEKCERITRLNEAEEKKYFYKKRYIPYEVIVDQYVEQFVMDEDKEKMRAVCSMEYIKEHLNKNNPFYCSDYRHVTQDGYRWYRIHIIRALTGEYDQLDTFVLAVMDVDKEIRYEKYQQELIQQTLLQAEKANRAKTTFLSNMSHDIRTPMNAIIGFTTLAINHIDETQRTEDYLKKIMTSSNQLLNLLNDVLDMSRIESGEIELENQKNNILDIIQNVRNIMQQQVQEKLIEFRVDIINVRDVYVMCDRLRLVQILLNLLGNAMKFTPERGNVVLRLQQLEDTGDGKATYQFIIKDTGIGISKEFKEHIFEPFEREKNTTASGIQGTGLGLSITKNIIDVMEGVITVESELEKGTEFCIELTFPLVEAEHINTSEDEKKEKSGALEMKKILLVEDNELNREIAKEFLEGEQYIVEEAVNGEIALEMLSESGDEPFDVVLMDIKMPVMDGYEATKQIRASKEEWIANVPVIAMTANVYEQDKKKAMESGMNAHIAKPVDMEELLKVIKSL